MTKNIIYFALGIVVIILIIAIGLILFFNSNRTDELEYKNKILTESAKQDVILLDAYREQKQIDKKVIDSLLNNISIEKETKEDEQVNNYENEKIRTINLYTTSEQQTYFDSIAGDYIRKAKKGSNIR